MIDNFYVHTKPHMAMPANTGCKKQISISFHLFFSKYANPVRDESNPRLHFSTAGPGESNRAMNLLSNCWFFFASVGENWKVDRWIIDVIFPYKDLHVVRAGNVYPFASDLHDCTTRIDCTSHKTNQTSFKNLA